MFIETEGTPNPAALKFLPGRYVVGDGTADFASPAAAERSPLASELFALTGVARACFWVAISITVTKTDENLLAGAEASGARRDHGTLRRRPPGHRRRRR